MTHPTPPSPYFGRRPPSRLACGSVVAGAVVLGIFVVAGSVWGLGWAMRWIGGP
jgi:hypothetical protein